jgi:hypothetical protein
LNQMVFLIPEKMVDGLFLLIINQYGMSNIRACIMVKKILLLTIHVIKRRHKICLFYFKKIFSTFSRCGCIHN